MWQELDQQDVPRHVASWPQFHEYKTASTNPDYKSDSVDGSLRTVFDLHIVIDTSSVGLGVSSNVLNIRNEKIYETIDLIYRTALIESMHEILIISCND